MESQKFCLKWDAFHDSITSAFDRLRQDEELVDITLCCEGQRVRAHRMMLSACSPYFRDILKNNQCQQMVIFLKDTTVSDLLAIMDYIYNGKVNVSQSQLGSFIKTAEMLQIRGLSGDDDKPGPESSVSSSAAAGDTTPPAKRRRRRSGSPSYPATSVRTPLSAPVPARVPASVAHATPPSAPYDSSRVRSNPAYSPPPPPPPPPLPPRVSIHPSEVDTTLPPVPSSDTADTIKIEKVDLTEEVEGTDCDTLLDDQLVDYAADSVGEGGGFSEENPDMVLVDLSEAMLPEETLGHGVLGDAAFGNVPGRGRGQLEMTRREQIHTGSVREGGPFFCPICGRSYSNYRSLEYHKKMHAGLTKCILCGKVTSKVEHLRRHLENVHKLTQEDIRSIVPTRPKHKGYSGMV